MPEPTDQDEARAKRELEDVIRTGDAAIAAIEAHVEALAALAKDTPLEHSHMQSAAVQDLRAVAHNIRMAVGTLKATYAAASQGFITTGVLVIGRDQVIVAGVRPDPTGGIPK